MRYLYWCIIYWILVIIAYFATFKYFNNHEDKIGEKLGLKLTFNYEGVELIKTEVMGLKFIIIGLYAIIFVLPIMIHHYFHNYWTLTLLGFCIMYYGIMMLYRRNVYNDDMMNKLEVVSNNKNENNEIQTYIYIILNSCGLPIAIFAIMSYIFGENVKFQTFPIMFNIIFAEFVVINIFLYVDKLNALLYKIFKSDFTYEHTWFYGLLSLVLPFLPYALQLFCAFWKYMLI